MSLTREQILAADDLPRERVAIKSWGGEVYIRSFTGEERDVFEESLLDRSNGDVKRTLANFRAKLVALCLVNDQGQRLFTAEQAEELGRKNGAILDQLAATAQKLNGLSAGDVENLTKN
jgi:hypothetical protein